ncbi:LPS export ABC transporter periplasmic protein LptC [Prolixibacteraceae bacterium JC049]|nr:LPS export ABC transporter periplasmic protein LptC [Prolixibacteraceae bacterium JC049]
MKQQLYVQSSNITLKRLMKQIKRSIVASLVGATVLFSSCKNDVKKIAQFETQEYPYLSSYNLKVTRTDSAKVQGTLEAPELHQYKYDPKKPYTEFPQGCVITRLNEETGELSRLSCKYAILHEKEQLYEAKINVVVSNGAGDTLKSEQLFWDAKKKLIYTDQFVQLISKNSVLSGTGFRSSQDLSNPEFDNLSGEVEFEQEEAQQ